MWQQPQPRISARALVRSGPLVLVASCADEAFYLLPGGGVEAGETPLQAVRREWQEETGWPLTDVRPLTVFQTHWTRRDGTPIEDTVHLFAAMSGVLPQQDLPRSPEGDCVLRWASVDDLLTTRRVVLEPAAVLPWIWRARYG